MAVMAEKRRKDPKTDNRYSVADDVPHIGLHELVEIRQAEMENFMLPNLQTTLTNKEGTKRVVVKSRELNITERNTKKKRRTA